MDNLETAARPEFASVGSTPSGSTLSQRMAVLNQKSILDMIKEFRRNWHILCDSERTTVCGADSMLLALQLSMADNNKQHNGEFTVPLSDVLLTWKFFLHEKLNLPVENMEVIDHYEDIRRTYDDFLKNSNMLDLIDVYKKCSVLISNCENNANISPSQLRDFLLGRQYAVADETDLYVPTSPMSKHNQDNEKVATSFIRTLELGGKGYAPSPSDPLRAHVKGLSNFINFIDKLDEILGEIPNPSIAGGRILSVIKMQLIKGQNSRDPFCKAVEEVAQDLDLRIKNIINSQQGDVILGTTDISPARPKSYAINHGTAYCGRDTVKILLVLLDEEAASLPTRNKAELLYDDENTIHHNGISILTLFRSPTQVNNSSMKPLRERIHKSMHEKKTKMKQTLIRSQFACTYKEDCIISKDKWNDVNSASEPLYVLHMENDLSACITEGVNSSVRRPTVGTSSGNVHLDRSKSEKVARKSSSQTGNKSSKRKQVDLDDENNLCDSGNEPSQHKNFKIPKTSNNFQNKLCGKIARVAKSNNCTGKDKLITGQTKLTQYFRL
ncbi:PCNA-interacting partner isoform X2 [Prionailurus viverrinus]|uniref:PCNA-interacting partner isoform X2 n=1 Tax=Prionailurus viverrinus TaxID=61388 RepID=UPI001FF6D72D|nr:PCNA-interacting partner isoform X2 [Prionailurus viverrinus]